MELLDISIEDLEMNKNIEGYRDNPPLPKSKSEEDFIISKDSSPTEQINIDSDIDKIDTNTLTKEDLALDFTTSSAISRVNIKFLAVYIPIFWLSGMVVTIVFYTFTTITVSG